MTQPQTDYVSQPQTDYLSTAGPYNYEQPLPPVTRTNAVTQVPPAKKITFYKSGDPQFGGVKMAINQRSFKSFNALMDDLSHRVPLPFGVRTITTPRGIHCISTLDQLEDGGCYLCSDKKYVTPISFGPPSRRAVPPRNSRPTSALRRAAQEAKREDYVATLAQQSPRIPKKITLVKNGDISTRRPIILNRRNARSFKTLLDEISEIMQFTVKKLYTVDGKRIDSMQALLHCPAVLVCVGREPFKPIVAESSRKPSSEKLPGLTSRSNSNNAGENSEMNFGLKAKKSVIHPRSSLSNRSTRFSLSSEKSFPNGLTTSPENGAASSNNCAHSKAGDVVHTLVNDDIEKKVHVNKDGSLSVEMKVRFRLLNDETLQWSTHIKKSNLLNQMPCEELGTEEDTGLDPVEKMNPEASSEADDSLYPCDADSYISKLDESEIEETHCHNCGRHRKDYDIWKNPMHASQKEEPGIRNTWYTHSSCSSTSSQRRIVRKKITSFADSIRTSSSGEEYSEHIVRESSSYSETVKNRLDNRMGKKCCCHSECTQPHTRRRRPPEEPEAAACLASSQNEDDEDAVEASMVTGEESEGKGSKAASGRSKASPCSTDSQTKVCEESSTVARSLSSCSVKKAEDLEDVAGCVSTPNSICSKFSKCSTPRAKDEQDETFENEQVIPSFSSEHCSMKEATEDEAGKVEEDIDEANSISGNMASKQSVKDDVSENGRSSLGKSFHPQTHESMRSDSDEVQICSVASSSSRISKKSKHSQNRLGADSKVSSTGSSTATKKKKKKSSLHAEDGRSNSTVSYCSRGSHELERTATEGQGSHDSNPHLSEVVPPSATNDERTSSISKRYSKSSRSSKKESQPEAASSPRSSFSESNEKNRDGAAKISSLPPSPRTGSVSESTCSKCGHVAIARNDDHQSVNSRISSHSGTKTKCTEAERNEDACSQSSVAQSSKHRQNEMKSLQAEAENSSRASVSESASMYSLHCPVPPKGRPSNRKRRTVVLKKSCTSASVCTESEPTADKECKGISDSSRPVSSVSKSLDTANAEGINSDMLKEETGSCQEKVREEETEAAVDEGSELMPSSLPNATPEEVVHEWLRNIPSETLLMKDEMDDDGEEGIDLSAEIPSGSIHQECLEEDKKEDTEELEDTPAIEAVEDGAEKKAEEAAENHTEEMASETILEKAEAGQAESGHSIIISQKSPQRELPSTIQNSVQIMKALLASKQETKLDRSQSLPEMSPTMGRKLSNSAKILITCLASLQLLDEQLDPPDKSKPSNTPRYMELLNIFQTLWFGCASETGGPSTGQQEAEQEKVASGIRGHLSKHGNFTAMSSSGVDVGSGDGGSREGSVVEGAKCTEEEAIEERSEEIRSKSFLEEEEVGGDEAEQEEPSWPPTACSKSEKGENMESSRVEEVAEAQDNQGSECGMGPDEEKEDTNQEEADGATKQPSNGEAEFDKNANEANNETVQESSTEEELVDLPPTEGEPSNRVSHQATVTTSPATHGRALDPDPVWVLKLLKKIEKEFMTHYVNAMNDFKMRWNLENNEELDVMIAELKEEVSKRIQKSIEKELRKIQSRAGKRVPRPPNGELRRESTLKAEGRRRRLQMSLLNGSQNKQPETKNVSRDRDEADFFFSTTIKDDVSELLSDDEYCPCDTCLRKKLSSKSTMNTVVTSNAPVMKAFDLQKILQTKKDNGTEKKEPEGISEEIQDEKEIPTEPAEEEPEGQKEDPAIESNEERIPDEPNEQEEEEVNEDGTETITNEVEAEGEEARNEVTEDETKIEGEAKAQEEEVKEDGGKEEVGEDKVEEEEQREEEEVVKEEEKEMNMDKQEGQEEDEEKEKEKEGEMEEGEDVKHEGEGKQEGEKEEDDVKEEEEDQKEIEDMKEEGEEKEDEEREEDLKQEGGEKDDEEREEIREEEEDVKEEEEMEEEEMKDDKEEEIGEEKEEEEVEVEEQKEEEDAKEREEQKEGEEEMGEEKGEEDMKVDQEEGENMKEKADEIEGEVEEEKEGEEEMGEEEKGEEDMKDEEAVKEEEEKEEDEENMKDENKENEETHMKEEERENREEEEMEEEEKTQEEKDMEEEFEEKEEEEVEEEEEKGEEDMKEEEAEKEEKGEEEEDGEENVQEIVDEMEEEEVEEEKEEDEEKNVKEEFDEMEEEEKEAQDEKEEDVKEEDETKEEEVDKEEVEVVKEDEEECKDDEGEMTDEGLEEEVDIKDEAEENEKEEEEKVEENDMKEDEEKGEEEEAEEKEVEEEEATEVVLEEDSQEVKSEDDEETNEEKKMCEGKEETYMEAEEESKLEDEIDSALEEPKAAEGDNQENASDCAENISDAETVMVSGGEGPEDNDAEDEAEVTDEEEGEEEAIPEPGCEARSETAEIEADSDDAGKDEVEEEEGHEFLQNDEDEKPNKAENEEIVEALEPSRSASAFSYSSSVGNCSQQSQKGSEDRSDGEDCNEEENENINNSVDEDAQADTKNKHATMYPESVEEEGEED